MSSTRPSRSCRTKQLPPVLPEIMSRINLLKDKYYENIRNEFNTVLKYFKNDLTLIAEFWLTDSEYNMLDFKHIYLLKYLFAQVDLNHPLVTSFLDNIMDTYILRKLEIIRVKRDKKVFYRIIAGETTE